jgi:hypothetical protein
VKENSGKGKVAGSSREAVGIVVRLKSTATSTKSIKCQYILEILLFSMPCDTCFGLLD